MHRIHRKTEEYGISSFVYKRRLPFHAKRFNDWLESMPNNVVRSKGIDAAQYNHVACLLSQAGSSCNIHPVTYWVASMSEAQQTQILAERQKMSQLNGIQNMAIVIHNLSLLVQN